MNEMQRRGLGAGTLSAILLVVVFGFQYIGGLAPCPLCIWQRWPHAWAIVLALLLFVLPWRIYAALGGLAMVTGAGIAAYHAGIEWSLWAGPDTCTAPANVATVSAADLVARLESARVVRCDDIAWQFAGLSLAGWNFIASLLIAVLWARAYASNSASQ